MTHRTPPDSAERPWRLPKAGTAPITRRMPGLLLLITLTAPQLLATELAPRFALIDAQLSAPTAAPPLSAGRYSATARIEARPADHESARFSLATPSAAGCETASGQLFADGFE
jgi:hypothetical protein